MSKTGFDKWLEEKKAQSPEFSVELDAIAFGKSLATLTWTKTPPAKPGWYWARDIKQRPGQTEITVVQVSSDLRVYLAGIDWEVGREDFDLWAGPIEAPPLPEDEQYGWCAQEQLSVATRDYGVCPRCGHPLGMDDPRALPEDGK